MNPWLRFALIVAAWDDLIRADLACIAASCRLKYAEFQRYLLARRLRRMVRRIQADPRFKSQISNLQSPPHESSH